MNLRPLAFGVMVLVVCVSSSVGGAKPMTPECRVIKVVDARGRPIAGAEVSLLGCDTQAGNCELPDVPSRDWVTDRGGRICAKGLLELEGGGALEVTAPDRLGGSCRASKHWAYPSGVPGARGTAPIVVKLDGRPLATAPLKGRITSSDGRPIKGATIAIESIFVGDGCSFAAEYPAATSSTDGRFSFGAVAKGTAELRITHPRFAPRTAQEAVPSGGADIVLGGGATWQGRVLDPDGVPLAACKVTAIAGVSWFADGACSDGRFSLQHLPAGDVDIVVATDERSPLGGRVWTIKARIVDGEQRQQDLPLAKGITLDGTIVTQDGAPIAAARLSAVPDWPDRRPERQVVVRADASGHFTFRGLPSGHWTIEGDLRALKGKIGRLDVDATTNTAQLRLIVPEPARN